MKFSIKNFIMKFSIKNTKYTLYFQLSHSFNGLIYPFH